MHMHANSPAGGEMSREQWTWRMDSKGPEGRERVPLDCGRRWDGGCGVSRRRVFAFLPQQRGEVKNKVEKKLLRHLTSERLRRTDTFCSKCAFYMVMLLFDPTPWFKYLSNCISPPPKVALRKLLLNCCGILSICTIVSYKEKLSEFHPFHKVWSSLYFFVVYTSADSEAPYCDVLLKVISKECCSTMARSEIVSSFQRWKRIQNGLSRK